MRLRVGLLLCLFAVISVIGCRKPLAPNIDRNRAPETWITAAPFDTITVTKGQPPQPGTIPIRFHVYWAGSDRDGAVVGYYWAVVETLVIAPDGGGRPPLPGPAPDDYRYTTRTDSTFIFTVAENFPDRQHAFFIYAVDEKGKADPTPARFIFNARDDDPPVPTFDECFGTGRVYYFDQNRVLRDSVGRFPITEGGSSTAPPRDTVPSGSRLTFRFHAEITIPGTVVKGFRYKLDEPELQPSDPESLFQGNQIEYQVPPGEGDPSRGGRDYLPVANGGKKFTLRAVDQANGSLDENRRFQMNFTPDTWFAGPDFNITGGPWLTNSLGEKFALLVNGRPPAGTGFPGTLLSADSIQTMPVDRFPRRTFLEIYKDTVFIRREGDTVHLGSWVVIHNGGFDRDSPYRVKAVAGAAGVPPGPVLTAGPPNGSPIGFRSLITNFQTPNGPLSSTNQTRLYPFFDPNDPLHFPRIGVYHASTLSGRAYSVQSAEDGDGGRDRRIDDGRRVVEFPRPGEEALRDLVLVYEVNFPPVLRTDLAAFRPRVSVVDTFTSRTWDLRLFNDDRDPYISGDPVGGPSNFSPNRFRFKITGLHSINGRDSLFTTHEPPLAGPVDRYKGIIDQVNLPVPANLLTGPVTLNVELCDCDLCELYAGTGRCINRDIQVYYVAQPVPASTTTPSRPGLD